MNIQAMMKQAQQLQKKMMDEKKSIDSKVFTGKSSIVSITMTGDKKVTGVDINMDSIESDDKEMLEDMIMLAVIDEQVYRIPLVLVWRKPNVLCMWFLILHQT